MKPQAYARRLWSERVGSADHQTQRRPYGRQRLPGDRSDRTSSESWEAAARNAVATAAGTVRDLRVAEVTREDVIIENGAISSYRARLSISFKYDTGD